MSAAFSIAQIYNIYFTFVRHRRAEILVYFCVKFTTCHGSYLAVALLRPPDSYRPPDPVWNLCTGPPVSPDPVGGPLLSRPAQKFSCPARTPSFAGDLICLGPITLAGPWAPQPYWCLWSARRPINRPEPLDPFA